MAVIIPTYRPKSVRNRCVIDIFVDFFVLSRWFFFYFSKGVGAFVIGLSQISAFFMYLVLLLNVIKYFGEVCSVLFSKAHLNHRTTAMTILSVP